MFGAGEAGVLLLIGAAGLILFNSQQSAIIGAGPITPATPKKKPQVGAGGTAKKAVNVKPKLKTSGSGSGSPGAGNKSKPSSSDNSKPSPKATVKWKSVSDIPPATRKKIVDSWIARARKIAVAKLAQIINAKKRSGYQTVEYTGGFGGTIAPTVPGVTGAIGANAYSAYEEALGLKPAGEPALRKKMTNTANGAIQDFMDCKDDKACRASAVKKFDQIISSNATSVANGLPQLRGQLDPTVSRA